MKEIRALAKKRYKYIERLWQVRIDISNFGTSIPSLFSSISTALFEIVTQVASINSAISKLFLSKIRLLPPYDLCFREVLEPEEEIPMEMLRANTAFLYKVTMARRTAARLSKRLAAKSSQLVYFPLPPLTLEAEFRESSLEEGTEKQVKTVPNIFADLNYQFVSKVAPSIRNMTSAVQEFRSQTFSQPPFLALHKPSSLGPPKFVEPSAHPSMAPREKEAPQVRLVESSIDEIPAQKAERDELLTRRSIPIIRMSTEAARSFKYVSEFSTQEIIPTINVSAEAARSFKYVTELPTRGTIYLKREVSIAKKTPAFPLVQARASTPLVEPQESPVSVPSKKLTPHATSSLNYVTSLPSIISEKEIQILNKIPAFSLFSIPKSSTPNTETTPRYLRPTNPLSMRPHQMMESSLGEVNPSLTSWLYPVLEILNGTHTLSAGSTAASTAEKVVRETLIQPVSVVEAPWTLIDEKSNITSSKSTTVGEAIEVKPVKLPFIVTSMVAALSKQYPLLFGGSEISETWDSSAELIQKIPEKSVSLVRTSDVKELAKLSNLLALAAAKRLIVQRLHEEFNIQIKEMNVSKPSYGERLGNLGTLYTARASISSHASSFLDRLPFVKRQNQQILSVARRHSRLSPASQTIRHKLDIAISTDSADEDLRDLEKKINRILSEQVRRYYGGVRI